METNPNPQYRHGLHPALLIAAIAVTLFSVLGIAHLAGWLPRGAQASEQLVASNEPDRKARVEESREERRLGKQLTDAREEARESAAREARLEREINKARQERREREARQAREARRERVREREARLERERVAAARTESNRRSTGAGNDDELPSSRYGSSAPARRTLPAVTAATCPDCGVIESVRVVRAPANPSGAGAVAGGVLGGVLGRQVGEGKGKDVATVAGAVLGGFAGHEVERRVRTSPQYEVAVRMADGSRQSVTYQSAPPWREGERVRVRGGQIESFSGYGSTQLL